MLPGLDQFACQNLAVPIEVMEHVVRVESSFNPLAIGVVGGRLQRQPRTLPEALATVRMLEEQGFNFSLGLAQVNRHNLATYDLASYEAAFQPCANLSAGARILAECRDRFQGDWGKAFSCYYSGNDVTGFRDGYVQKVFASMGRDTSEGEGHPIRVIGLPLPRRLAATRDPTEAQRNGRDSYGSSRIPIRQSSTGATSLMGAEPGADARDAGQASADRAFVF